MSSFARASLAASSSGFASLRSASTSSTISWADAACLLTTSASAETIKSYSFALDLSAFTLSKAIFSSSFFTLSNG